MKINTRFLYDLIRIGRNVKDPDVVIPKSELQELYKLFQEEDLNAIKASLVEITKQRELGLQAPAIDVHYLQWKIDAFLRDFPSVGVSVFLQWLKKQEGIDKKLLDAVTIMLEYRKNTLGLDQLEVEPGEETK